jgi:sugar phosphate isomerase/epimerase
MNAHVALLICLLAALVTPGCGKKKESSAPEAAPAPAKAQGVSLDDGSAPPPPPPVTAPAPTPDAPPPEDGAAPTGDPEAMRQQALLRMKPAQGDGEMPTQKALIWAIDRWEERMPSLPKDVNELVAKGYLKPLPPPPASHYLTRRAFVGSLAAIATVGFAAPPAIGLGLGNYGFKSFKTTETVSLIAGMGYDSIEFTMMPGWDTEPVKMAAAQRKEIRKQVAGYGLAVPCLLDGINLMGEHQANLERIRRNAQFGQDVNPAGPAPIVQTHLGGKDTEWEQLKDKVVDRLRDWAKVGQEMQTVVYIKGHNLNLMDNAARSLWVMQQVKSPWLRIIYDYSHYQASGDELGKSLDLLLPYIGVISIKDGKPNANGRGYERLLPGEGNIDYQDYYHRLLKGGYAGHTVVEISSQIHSRPGYESIPTAKKCYAYMARVMEQAGVRRPEHKPINV